MNECQYCKGVGQFADEDDTEFYDCFVCSGSGLEKQEFRVKTDRGYVLCGGKTVKKRRNYWRVMGTEL